MSADPALPVPVRCEKCGWIGQRRAASINVRACPSCDSDDVKRWTAIEKLEEERAALEALPLESAIAETFAPVAPLPVPYVLRSVTGEVQIFRVPAHSRRGARRRRR